MSLEDQEDHLEDFPFHSLKIRNQNTTICVRSKGPSELTLELELQSSLDCSFERGIHEDNIEILRSAAAKYL